MKKHFFRTVLLLLLVNFSTWPYSAALAQQSTDSLAYELQRGRVNRMLDARKAKFGKYDQSLQMKTGIFGIFKTKNDMQHSLDILQEIILTDNEILVETKKLIDLKDYEKAYYQRLAEEYDIQRAAYMKTISKLQQENDKLRGNIATLETLDHDNDVFNYYGFLVILVLFALLIVQYRKYHPKKLTKL